MSSPDIEARARAVQEQNQLVQQLRQSGNEEEANRLQETYHAREMSGLASDVYLAAKHAGEPPTGWTRASSNPEALRAAGINLPDQELRDLLQPPQSGFRAEIYIPDKRIFGDDAKPVVVYKGSTGEIVDPLSPSGRRESGGEDFLNNGQQGIGMRSDYYDRAMGLASLLNKQVGNNFEIAGHSLGGGMASAASAVTGVRATTFNAAGLHPDTPGRFAKENGLPTFNPQQTVRTYQTGGEVLNDVQNGMQRLSEEHRHGYGLLANEAGLLLREPMMQKLVGDRLRDMMPPGAQTSAAQFIEQLATKPGQDALRNIPIAAGQLELLEPKTRVGDQLVDRAKVSAPSQVAELAGPLSTVLHAGAHGMQAGRLVGQGIETVGAGIGYGLDKVGDVAEQTARVQGMVLGKTVDMGSATLQVSTKAGATVIASGRELTGMVESTLHRVESRAQSGVWSAVAWGADLIGKDDLAKDLRGKADSARHMGDARAEHATRDAREDAAEVRAAGQRVANSIDNGGQWVAGSLRNGYATAGAYVDKGYDFVGYHVKHATAQAPAVLATVGGTTAVLGSAAASHLPVTPWNAANLGETIALRERAGPAFAEAAARHGMGETVIPSLDFELAKQEAAARRLVEQHQRMQHPGDGRQAGLNAEPASPVVGINDPRNADYKLFKGAQTGVHALDVAHNLTPDLHSDQLAGALASKAKQGGLASIEHVVLSTDRTRVFAVDTQDTASVHRKLAQVDIAEGRQQPLSVSTEQVAEVNRQQVAQATPDKQQAQDLDAGQRDQEHQAAARRMG